jgi:DNA polymerase III epsilon subunit-like protein
MIDSLTIATIDTETVGLEGHVYDIAWCIHNKRGDIRIERNFLVEENFTDPAKMMGAFYAGKHFTHYARMLQDGEVRLTPWAEIVATMRADFLVHGVNVVAAYNAGFDFRVLAQTHRELAGGGKMLTDAVKVLDIWQFACETKLSQKAYANIARAMGWVSPAGNIKTGAEFAHRYCSGDHSFIEDHTALSDARIEVEILAECFRQKKRVPYGVVNASPWRIVNQNAGDDPHVHGGITA